MEKLSTEYIIKEHLGILINHQCAWYLTQDKDKYFGLQIERFNTSPEEIMILKNFLFDNTNYDSLKSLAPKQKIILKKLLEEKIKDTNHSKNCYRLQEYYGLEKSCERMFLLFEIHFLFKE